jgi:thiamine biosynthesis protein ThiS
MITLNGKVVDEAQGLSLSALLARENYPLRLIAAAYNGEIIHKTKYDYIQLADGDVVDIVRIVAGG